MSDTKVIANLRLEKSLKEQAIDVATKMWLSLSAVMSLLLRKFVIEKKKYLFDNRIKDGKELCVYWYSKYKFINTRSVMEIRLEEV